MRGMAIAKTMGIHFGREWWLGLLLAWILLAVPAWAGQSYYADAGRGDDARDGRTPATAWKTLDRVNAAQTKKQIRPGDAILFKRGGIFPGTLMVAVSGSPGQPVRFGAYGEGTAPVVDAAGKPRGLDCRKQGWLEFADLEVRNAQQQGILFLNGVHDIVIHGCHIRGAGGAGVECQGGEGENLLLESVVVEACAAGFTSKIPFQALSLKNCSFSGHRGIGLFLASVDRLSMAGCSIEDNRGPFGISLNGCRGLTLVGLQVCRNAGTGVSLSGVSEARLEEINASGNGSVNLYVADQKGAGSNGIVVQSSRFDRSQKSCGVLIDGNGKEIALRRVSASGNALVGILVQGSCRRIWIDQCLGMRNGTWGGFFLGGASGLVSDSWFSNNVRAPLACATSAPVSLTGNFFLQEENADRSALLTLRESGPYLLQGNWLYGTQHDRLLLQIAAPAWMWNNTMAGERWEREWGPAPRFLGGGDFLDWVAPRRPDLTLPLLGWTAVGLGLALLLGLLLAWRPSSWLSLFFVAAYAAVIFVCIIVAEVPSDIQSHCQIALDMGQGRMPWIPNFLYFGLVYVLSAGLGFSGTVQLVAAGVLTLATLAKAWISLCFLGRAPAAAGTPGPAPQPERLHLQLAWMLPLAFSLPMHFDPWGYFYLGQITPNVWHNSTVIFLMPFALALFWLSYEQLRQPTWVRMGWIALLIILNVLIKPSFCFVFVVGYPMMLFSVYRLRREFWINLLPIAAAAILIFIEYRMLFGGHPAGGQEAGVTIQPGRIWGLYSQNIPLSIVMSLFFPILYAILNWRQLRPGSLLSYAWVLEFGAIAIFFIFAETGLRQSDGNFSWQCVVCTYILFAVTLKQLLQEVRLADRIGWRAGVSLAAFAFHLLFGLVYVARLFYLHLLR